MLIVYTERPEFFLGTQLSIAGVGSTEVPCKIVQYSIDLSWHIVTTPVRPAHRISIRRAFRDLHLHSESFTYIVFIAMKVSPGGLTF